MTICDIVEAITEGSDVIYTLFDCNSQEVLMVATDESENAMELSRDDLLFSEYADYEVEGMDVWIDKGRVHIEFNIEVDEEDEEIF